MNLECIGRVTEALVRVEEMLDAAKVTGDADLLIPVHTTANIRC